MNDTDTKQTLLENDTTTEKLKKQGLEQIILCGRFLDSSLQCRCSHMLELMEFTRFSFRNEIHEELLFGESLKERCTREDITYKKMPLWREKKKTCEKHTNFTESRNEEKLLTETSEEGSEGSGKETGTTEKLTGQRREVTG